MWNTQTYAHIEIPLEGHEGSVTSVSFSPSGQQAVSASAKILKLWDTKTFAQIGDPFKHSDWVWDASFSSDGLRIVSAGRDKTVRLWSAQTHQQIGDPFQGHARQVALACESSDGKFVVSGDNITPETIIWGRRSRAIVWRSTEDDADANNTISNIDAESIIRRCGQRTPHLWPSSFPEYTADLHCTRYALYSNITGEKTSLGNFPSDAQHWEYEEVRKVIVAGLSTGAVAFCRLVAE